MAALDDLKAAVSQLDADVKALIGKPTGVSDAELQPIVQQVNDLDASVKAAIGQ